MKNDGGPAFPPMVPDKGYGLSKREYFSGQAIAGLCASLKYRPSSEPHDLAQTAVKLADALLAELAKEE